MKYFALTIIAALIVACVAEDELKAEESQKYPAQAVPASKLIPQYRPQQPQQPQQQQQQQKGTQPGYKPQAQQKPQQQYDDNEQQPQSEYAPQKPAQQQPQQSYAQQQPQQSYVQQKPQQQQQQQYSQQKQQEQMAQGYNADKTTQYKAQLDDEPNFEINQQSPDEEISRTKKSYGASAKCGKTVVVGCGPIVKKVKCKGGHGGAYKRSYNPYNIPYDGGMPYGDMLYEEPGFDEYY